MYIHQNKRTLLKKFKFNNYYFTLTRKDVAKKSDGVELQEE